VDVIFEHRVYLPSAGVFVAVAAGVCLLSNRLSGVWTKAVAGILVAVVVVLSGTAYARNNVWRSEISLWGDVVRKSPENARGHNNLGNKYISEGKVDKAIQHYLLALEARPWIRPSLRDYTEIHYNIANAYRDSGLLDKAIEHYKESLRIDFNNLDAYNNLGMVYFSKGLTEKAITYYQAAIELDPDYAEAHFNLAEAYWAKGLVDKSIENYKAFLEYRLDYAEAHYNIGVAYEAKGMTGKAENHFRMALELSPDYEGAREKLRQAIGDKLK
jgi:tetratricopeptide (TPR) repeat protein